MARNDEYGVVRLRGAFLDVGPDRSLQIRRHSWPAFQASIPDHSSWIDSLLESASNLSSQRSENKCAHKRARKRTANYNTNGCVEPLTTYNFEGERKVPPMDMMCHNSSMTADSHTATQSLESPVTTPSGADSSVSVEIPAAAGKITTLIIHCIPQHMSIEQLIEFLHSHGFANTYDLLYMPGSTKSQGQIKNSGYMFVNFRKPEGAEAFAETFKDFRFPARRSWKPCKPTPSRCQGFEENMKMHTSGKGPGGWLGTFGEQGLTQWVWT